MLGRKIIGLERSLPVRLAKIVFGSGFLAVRRAESEVFENQATAVVQADLGVAGGDREGREHWPAVTRWAPRRLAARIPGGERLLHLGVPSGRLASHPAGLARVLAFAWRAARRRAVRVSRRAFMRTAASKRAAATRAATRSSHTM